MDLTVVLPVRNGAATLARQLRALADQTDAPPFEVVVGDNGSTDDTRARALEFSDRLTLRVVDAGERVGAAAARNIAASRADGTRLLFCDADDIVQPEWVTAHQLAAERAPLVAGAIVHVRDGRPGRVPSSPPTLLGWKPYAQTANASIDHDVFRQIGGFDEEILIGEDVDLSWRVQLAGAALDYERDAVVHKDERQTLGARVRQHAAYGRADVDLYRHYHDSGVPGPSARAIATSYGGLVARLPRLRDTDARARWAAQLGRRWGRATRSVERRTLYL